MTTPRNNSMGFNPDPMSNDLLDTFDSNEGVFGVIDEKTSDEQDSNTSLKKLTFSKSPDKWLDRDQYTLEITATQEDVRQAVQACFDTSQSATDFNRKLLEIVKQFNLDFYLEAGFIRKKQQERYHIEQNKLNVRRRSPINRGQADIAIHPYWLQRESYELIITDTREEVRSAVEETFYLADSLADFHLCLNTLSRYGYGKANHPADLAYVLMKEETGELISHKEDEKAVRWQMNKSIVLPQEMSEQLQEKINNAFRYSLSRDHYTEIMEHIDKNENLSQYEYFKFLFFWLLIAKENDKKYRSKFTDSIIERMDQELIEKSIQRIKEENALRQKIWVELKQEECLQSFKDNENYFEIEFD